MPPTVEMTAVDTPGRWASIHCKPTSRPPVSAMPTGTTQEKPSPMRWVSCLDCSVSVTSRVCRFWAFL